MRKLSDDPSIPECLQQETRNLVHSWQQYEPEMLRDYLVAGVEDPRINLQSILSRHYLIVSLLGTRFGRLLEQELRFGVVMNWIQETFSSASAPQEPAVVRHALATGADNAEGWPIPRLVREEYRSLPLTDAGYSIPNYLKECLSELEKGSIPPNQAPLSEGVLMTFQRIWRQALETQEPRELKVLEAACGSANDFRFLDQFGIARLVQYAGFDLSEKNVRNAKRMFPKAHFFVGNAFALGAADQAFDYGLAQDLFEHLSPPALDAALGELCRVTRRGLCLGFFNLHESEEHVVQPIDQYHWNRLSVPRLRAKLESLGFSVDVVHLDTFLRWRFAFERTHNKNAYTFFAERPRRGP